MKIVIAAAAFACIGSLASAQALNEKAARSQVFDHKRTALQINANLSAQDQATVKALIPLMAEQFRQPANYYSAIAFHPTDGLVSESLQAAMNHHSTEAAARAALAACDAATSSAGPCQIAAQIVPRGYQLRDFTLSQSATEALQGRYRKSGSPKALAVSPTTGVWAIAAGDAAALAACRANGAGDCEVRVSD